MGREIKRVPLTFEWPLNKRWEGFLSPDSLDGKPCTGCDQGSSSGGDGYSRHAQHLFDLWYGKAPGIFRPEDNGSTPLTVDTPAVRAFAERQVDRSPEFYGSGERAIVREARRLCDLWNNMWCHHLNHDDVVALIQAGRLRDFTHRWSKADGWEAIEPPVVPLPDEVNAWSIGGFGHDAINASAVVEARCEREGYPNICDTCDGHGSVEAYPGQRVDADAWEPTEPPTGDGWQLWETVSEGSPISPVFPDAEGLAQWLTTPASCWGASQRPMTITQARGFVGAGWAPTGFVNAGGVHNGAEYIGTEEALGSVADF